jgi:hypothetical protein
VTRRQPLVRRTWRGDYRASEESEGECEVSDNGEVITTRARSEGECEVSDNGEVSDVKMVKRVKESDRQKNKEGK